MRFRPLSASVLLIGLFGCERGGGDAEARPAEAVRPAFDGQAALEAVRAQVAFGPRVPGTAAHRAAGDWLVAQLRASADSVVVQAWTHRTVDGISLPMRNILARFRPTAAERVLYVAHWDSRPRADAVGSLQPTAPVPGANDGGLGSRSSLRSRGNCVARRRRSVWTCYWWMARTTATLTPTLTS